ncbi:MAG: hypothetical protein WCJ74_01565 [bacterium]
MKSIKQIATFILAFALIGTSFAQTYTKPTTPTPVTQTTITTPPPASLPIGSKGMLRAYALEQVAGSDMSIWSEAIMWSSDSVTNVYFHPEVAPSVDEAIQALSFNWFNFKVSDKTKPLYVYASLHNKDGMSLFYGNVNASRSENGLLVCPGGVEMKMGSWTPIYVGENVKGASIRLDNGDRVSLNVWNGYVFFQGDYTDKDGMIVLDFDDGSSMQQIGYSLRTCLQVPLYKVSGTVGAYLGDYYSFIVDDTQPGTTYVNLGNCQVGGDHEAPVASINITSSTPRTVKFFCQIWDNSTLVEQPGSGWIFKKGSDTEMPVSLAPVAPGEWSAPITLEPGEWFFYMDTELFETPAPDNYYGGKG